MNEHLNRVSKGNYNFIWTCLLAFFIFGCACRADYRVSLKKNYHTGERDPHRVLYPIQRPSNCFRLILTFAIATWHPWSARLSRSSVSLPRREQQSQKPDKWLFAFKAAHVVMQFLPRRNSRCPAQSAVALLIPPSLYFIIVRNSYFTTPQPLISSDFSDNS